MHGLSDERAASLAATGRKLGTAVLVGGSIWALAVFTIMTSMGGDMDRFLAIGLLLGIVLIGLALTTGGRIASQDATPRRGCMLQLAGGALLVLLVWIAFILLVAQNIR